MTLFDFSGSCCFYKGSYESLRTQLTISALKARVWLSPKMHGHDDMQEIVATDGTYYTGRGG